MILGTVELIMLLILLVIVVPLCLLPTIIALSKNHQFKIPIILLNIFGGLFFGLGWVAALIWCFIEQKNET
ncbi:MAG: superinfection immunity protein [Gammaproteobacteria bacterium]|nr:superinfection immunity protein [Gammaproteobacteria bacterium]